MVSNTEGSETTSWAGPPKNVFDGSDAERVKDLLVKEYLRADTESITFTVPPTRGSWNYHHKDYNLKLSSADLEALAEKCPNLRSITDIGHTNHGIEALLRLSTWPISSNFSWTSLEELHLYHTYFPPEMFKNIQGSNTIRVYSALGALLIIG